MWAVSSYVLKQKLRKRRRYPLVLMLEPLLRCNLSCSGCGKIQYPGHILKKEMSVAQALAAVDECGAPVVSIPGGEPLLYSKIGELVQKLIAKKKYIYLCTNALLLRQKIEEGVLKPSKFLTLSVHLDGDEEAHDYSVCREGTYQKAESAIQFAVARGFRVTCNTTLYNHANVERTREFFDRMMDLGVEGVMLSPGYSYSKAPNQDNFLTRQKTFELFRGLFKKAKKSWKFNQSPLFLEFLMGKRHFECTPWGNPCYTLFGWQRPCYLLQEGYAASFQELLSETEWHHYGRHSGNPKCANCMVHCGYEPTAVDTTFGSWPGFWATVKATLFGIDSDRGENIEIPEAGHYSETGSDSPLIDSVTRELLELADFRGDVKLILNEGEEKRGFLFNVTEKFIEFFPDDEIDSARLPRDSIAHIEKTGQDWADGRSWKSWLEKRKKKKEALPVSK